MRELLNDLEAGSFVSHENPMERARAQMRQPQPKRFYKTVEVSEVEGGFRVLLDGKPVRTPGRAFLALPTAAAAQIVADEFDAQGEILDIPAMPVLRLANTALDGVAQDPQAVLEDVLRYASCDLVCYRADGPEPLVARQAECWDAVIDWARATLSARMVLAEGVMHVDQPREAIAAIGIHLNARKDPFRLAALHVMTSLTGSALLALAVDEGQFTAEEAWKAAHVDEDWNIEQWGEDAEAAAMRVVRQRDMMGAARLLAAL
ncbi:MAG: ATPase [Mesorhizobium sp.]|nr:ATPase [Mesorhizobium sp.]